MGDLDLPAILLLLGYASLVLDLLVFSVPSEASTLQLFTGASRQDGVSCEEALGQARARGPLMKVAAYLLPTGIGVVCFMVPPVAVFVPDLREYLAPFSLPAEAVWRWSGAFLVVAGRGLTVASAIQIRRATRSDPLRNSGLFGWSRNPGLVGMYGSYVGATMMTPCLALVAGFFLYVWNMGRRVRMEEGFLRLKVGPEYDDYLASVPRFLRLR